jgi:hypothetical protein
MARTTRVVLTCDLHDDGTEAASTVLLVDGGVRAELDLCRAHIDELFGSGRKVRTTKGAAAARRTRDGATSKAKAKSKASGARRAASRPAGPSPSAIREWAAANGHTVRGRGRIPASVMHAYADAHTAAVA